MRLATHPNSPTYTDFNRLTLLKNRCLSRIMQKAFPGSWREQMGQKFCSTEMPSTPEYEAIQHYKNDKLAGFAPSVQLAVERFERQYPRLDTQKVTVSVFDTSSPAERRALGQSERVEVGSSIVVDSGSQDLGELEVTLGSSEWKVFLPVQGTRDGDPVFVLPSQLGADESVGKVELVVRRTYASSPSPLRDPISPCSIMGHIANQPDRKQLLALQAGPCRGVDPDSAYNLATSTWPHSKLRNEELFRTTVHLVAPAVKEEHLGRDGLETGSGAWHLEPYASQAEPPMGDDDSAQRTRLYTPERCPSYFDAKYWSSCGTSRELERQGIYRWVPEGHESYTSFAMPAGEIRECLTGRDDDEHGTEGNDADETTSEDDSDPDGDKLRILVVGDSVASHTFMALGCLVEQVSSVTTSSSAPESSLRVNDHVRFRSFQYEMFDLVNSTLTRSDWLELLSWSSPSRLAADDEVDLPDVVILNVGLWATTWSTLSSYETGLELAARHLGSIARKEGRRGGKGKGMGMRIIWRETTATFPQEGQDPLYQINPRVEVFNSVAERVLLHEEARRRRRRRRRSSAGDAVAPTLRSRASWGLLGGGGGGGGGGGWGSWLTGGGGANRGSKQEGPVIEYLAAYEMTRSRGDQARDNAHMCPVVQGDLAELVMHQVCRRHRHGSGSSSRRGRGSRGTRWLRSGVSRRSMVGL